MELRAQFVVLVMVSFLLVVVLLLDLSSSTKCFAAPILAPDVTNCHPHPITAPYNCCAPPPPRPPIEFQFPSSPTIKVRRPAHLATDEYALKLSRAYQLIRALPLDDPRSFGHQANIHCAYCNEFYSQGNSTTLLQVHGSWLFFPFHRWYLYFHERILARLLGDDTFALPYWNYDHPDGSAMPRLYVEYPDLSHRLRQPSHLPPAVAEIDFAYMGPFGDRSNFDQLNVNRAAMHWVMVTGATTQYSFFGQPYRLGDLEMPGYGTVESFPHNGVHGWTGDMNESFRDMGVFATSARDPMFYAHHSNIDRLWDVWKTLAEGNVDIDDPDYLDSEFVFYDENADLVKVTVRDSLNASKLGYMYEDVELLWLNETPVARSSGAAKLGDDALVCKLGKAMEEPCSAVVMRNKTQTSRSYDSDAEMLVIQGIQVEIAPAQFNVFVNLPTANASTLINCTEFAGVFSTLVATSSVGSTLQLGIGFIVKELDLAMEETLVITIVPISAGSSAVKISGLGIECQDARKSLYVL